MSGLTTAAEQLRTFQWMGLYRPKSKYDLSRNELFEQDLVEMGVETSYEEFLKEPEPSRFFRETVSEIYGVEPENIVPTLGGTEGIFLAAAFTGSVSPRIVVPLPDYEPIFVAPRVLGNRVVPVPENKIVDTLLPTDSVMMTSPSNPGGNERIDLYRSVLSTLGRDSRVYVDETFSEFRFTEKPKTLFGKDERTFCSSTMTKFFGMSSIRTGWIMASRDDVAEITHFKNISSAANPQYPLWLASNILKQRQAYSRKVSSILRENLPVADKFVKEIDYLSWEKPESAPFGFVKYGMETDAETLCVDIYKKTGILLVPGDYFGEDHGFRLCFFLPPEKNREAFEILTEYFHNCPFT